MKIYDIIKEDTIESFLRETDEQLRKQGILLEAPQPAGAVPPGMSWNGSMWVPAAPPAPTPTAPSAPTPPAPGSPAASSSAAKRARIATKKAKRVVSASAGTQAEKFKLKIKKEMTLIDLRGNKIDNLIPKTAFRFMVAIKWLGMTAFFYEYWQQKVAIDSLASKGEMTPEDASAAQRIIIEELVVKIMISAGFANLLKWLMRLRYLKWLVRAGAAIGAGATLGIFGGPAIIAVLAAEAATIALQQFLNSEKGKEIIAYCVMYAIDPAVTWVWDAGPGAWFAWLKSPQLSDKGKEQVAQISKTPGKGEEKADAARKNTGNIAGKPADGSADVDASSSGAGTQEVPAYGPGGRDLGWASSNPLMGKGGGTAPPVERRVVR
jgi:hypothetical protein